MNGMSVSSSSLTQPPHIQKKKHILLYCNVQSLSRLVKSISRRGKSNLITIQKWITADTFELSRWDFQILPAFSALHTWLFAAPTQLFQYCGQCPRVSQSCMLSCVCVYVTLQGSTSLVNIVALSFMSICLPSVKMGLWKLLLNHYNNLNSHRFNR